MKKVIRNGLLLIVTLTASMTLAGCGQQRTSQSTRVTVTFWHGMTGHNKTVLQGLVQDFNRSQSTYRVVANGQGTFSNLQQKIMTAAKSKTLPTIAQTSYTNVPNYVKGGLIAPFNTDLSAKELAGIRPVFLKAGQYQGNQYALPFSKSVRIMYYNQRLLKQLNLKVPTTWKAVHHVGQVAQQHGLTGLALDRAYLGELDDLAHAAGQPLVTTSLKVNAAAPQTVDAVQPLAHMLKTGTAKTAGADNYGNVRFLKGRTVLYCGSSAALGIIQASAPKDFQWGTTQTPSYQGQRANCVAGNDLVRFKTGTKAQRQGGAAFIKYLLQNRQTIRWATQTGYLPVTTAATTTASYQRYLKKHPKFKAAASELKTSYTDPAFLGYSQYLTALQTTADDLAVKHVAAATALNKLQQTTETIIKTNQN